MLTKVQVKRRHGEVSNLRENIANDCERVGSLLGLLEISV